MWSPLLRRITEAPFLQPVTATALVEQVDPPNPNAESALVAPASSFFDPAYADRIDSLRDRVEAYGSMLGPTSDIPIELRRKLFWQPHPRTWRTRRPENPGSPPSIRRPGRRSTP